MYKLNQHSLTRGEWFEPETQSMTLAERNTVSSITLGPDAPEIGFNDWILDEEWPEGPTVWRVKSIDDQTDSKTVTVSLEHVIRLLEDIKLFEAVETGDISGGDYCTARQAIEYLLAQQSDWVLGDLRGDDVSLPYEFSGGDSLFDAIESVSDTLEDAEWWYDLSRYPFVLHIRKRNSSVMSEMRGERNLSTLRRNISRSGMYTRIWPVGYNDLHISGAYLSKNESLYGRVDKVETNQGKTSEDSLRAWARAMLRKHCEPNVTITISGLELSQETGEPLDWIQLNRVCRCPLPEFHTTILERVIKIAWRDRRKDPESITVTLGNNAADVQDLTKTVSETSKSSGSAARGQAKQNYLFEANGEHLLYEVFDECGHLHGVLRMTEQSLRVAFENLNECTRSEFYMTSESLRVQFENEINSTRSEFQMTSESLRVTFENEINSTRSQIEVTSESLRVQFENEINSTRSQMEITSESLRVQFENEINSTRSEFQITSESLRVAFENEVESVRSQVEQTDRSWKASVAGVAGADGKVTAASIAVAINDDGSYAYIDAEHILIGSDQTAEVVINSLVTRVNTLEAESVTTNNLSAKIADLATVSVNALTAAGNISASGAIMGTNLYFGSTGSYTNVGNAIANFGVAQENDGSITIPTTKLDGSQGTPINFNIAATQYFIDGVAANRASDVGSVQTTEDTAVQLLSEYNTKYKIQTRYKRYNGTWANGSGYVVLTPPDRYQTGYDAGKPTGATLGSKTATTGIYYNVLVTKGDGGQQAFEVDLSAAYTAARSGYTLGIFTEHADITPISSTSVRMGSAMTITPISSTKIRVGGATNITPISGSAIVPSIQSINVASRNGSYNLRGSTAIMLKDDGSERHYDVNGSLIGNFHWYHVVSSGGTNYYTANGSAAKYDVTPTNYCTVSRSLDGVSLYKAGTEHSYRRNYSASGSDGTEYYTAGTPEVYRPVLSSGGTLFYTAGTKVTGLYTKE